MSKRCVELLPVGLPLGAGSFQLPFELLADPFLLICIFLIPSHQFRSGVADRTDIQPAACAGAAARNGLNLRARHIAPILHYLSPSQFFGEGITEDGSFGPSLQFRQDRFEGANRGDSGLAGLVERAAEAKL